MHRCGRHSEKKVSATSDQDKIQWSTRGSSHKNHLHPPSFIDEDAKGNSIQRQNSQSRQGSLTQENSVALQTSLPLAGVSHSRVCVAQGKRQEQVNVLDLARIILACRMGQENCVPGAGQLMVTAVSNHPLFGQFLLS